MQEQYTLTARRPRKSATPFDALFAVVAERSDITATAKVVYAKLTTMLRLGETWTQEEIGDRTGLSRRTVIRSVNRLIAADLVTTTRYGQGYPNAYALKGVEQDDLFGQADTPEARKKRIRAVRYQQLLAIYGEMCLRCGATKRLQIDHVVPIALSGPDVFSNLQLLCRSCNQEKGATTADYRQSPGTRLAAGVNPA